MSSSSDKVRASHILIKHKGSRRKASWKDPDGHVITSTTRESAVAQLKALRDDIVSGKAKFNDSPLVSPIVAPPNAAAISVSLLASAVFSRIRLFRSKIQSPSVRIFYYEAMLSLVLFCKSVPI
ncbi:hypothetical protein C3L33_22039, partial [Rhododendron williamsianum]